MTDPVKQELAQLFDRFLSDLESLKQKQLNAKNSRTWRWVSATIELVTAVRAKIMAFQH